MTDGWGDASGIEGNYEDESTDSDGESEASETERAVEGAASNETTSRASETNDTSGTSEQNSEKTNIKDEWNGRTIYIPDGVLAEMEDTYLESQLKLRKSGRDEFKKNRHFYPLLVQFGLEALAEADAEEIRGRLSELGDD